MVRLSSECYEVFSQFLVAVKLSWPDFHFIEISLRPIQWLIKQELYIYSGAFSKNYLRTVADGGTRPSLKVHDAEHGGEELITPQDNDTALRDMILNFIIAGRDTMAVSLLYPDFTACCAVIWRWPRRSVRRFSVLENTTKEEEDSKMDNPYYGLD